MKLTSRSLKPVVTIAALLAVAFGALVLWNKHNFCRGWADEYSAQAIQLRTDAANPTLSPDEKKEHLVAANLKEIVSRKYRSVAWMPWKPYPSDPLISDEEKWSASQVQ
jgi:hypothetical protein